MGNCEVLFALGQTTNQSFDVLSQKKERVACKYENQTRIQMVTQIENVLLFAYHLKQLKQK